MKRLGSNNKILIPEEVAKYLKVKKRTLYKWVKEGTIPAHKLGGSWRFIKKEVDEWIENNKNIIF